MRTDKPVIDLENEPQPNQRVERTINSPEKEEHYAPKLSTSCKPQNQTHIALKHNDHVSLLWKHYNGLYGSVCFLLLAIQIGIRMLDVCCHHVLRICCHIIFWESVHYELTMTKTALIWTAVRLNRYRARKRSGLFAQLGTPNPIVSVKPARKTVNELICDCMRLHEARSCLPPPWT